MCDLGKYQEVTSPTSWAFIWAFCVHFSLIQLIACIFHWFDHCLCFSSVWLIIHSDQFGWSLVFSSGFPITLDICVCLHCCWFILLLAQFVGWSYSNLCKEYLLHLCIYWPRVLLHQFACRLYDYNICSDQAWCQISLLMKNPVAVLEIVLLQELTLETVEMVDCICNSIWHAYCLSDLALENRDYNCLFPWCVYTPLGCW